MGHGSCQATAAWLGAFGHWRQFPMGVFDLLFGRTGKPDGPPAERASHGLGGLSRNLLSGLRGAFPAAEFKVLPCPRPGCIRVEHLGPPGGLGVHLTTEDDDIQVHLGMQVADDRVRLELGDWHSHFQRVDEAVEFLRDLVGDKTRVKIYCTTHGHREFGGVLGPGESPYQLTPDEAAHCGWAREFATIEVCTWSGELLQTLPFVGERKAVEEKPTPTELTADQWHSIDERLRARQKTLAIKMYREYTGAGLKDATDRIEARMRLS